ELFLHSAFLISSRLNTNFKYEEADQWLRRVFDPYATGAPDDKAKYWKVKPLWEAAQSGPATSSVQDLVVLLTGDPANQAYLDQKRRLEAEVARWLKNPFNPFAVAAVNPVAYQRYAVMAMVKNLIDLGDSYFRQFTAIPLKKADLHYNTALAILGPRPVIL